MKKFCFLMLSVLTLPTFAQSMLNTLNQHQNSLQEQGSSSSSTNSSTPEVTSSTESISSSTQKCEENDQTSLPLAYVTSLIQEKNGQLNILHDPRTGSLSVSSGGMIGNCSSMLQWKLKQPTIQGTKAYAIEVKIKQGENCSDAGCSYKVAKVQNGEFQKHEDMVLKPTLKGFEECLKKSGVVADGKVVPGSIYNIPVNEKFTGLQESGSLLFLSHGPSSPLVKAKYGNFQHVDACDYYETAHPDVKRLLTLADAEEERLNAEAARLRECKADEYGKLAEFIEKYEDYADELGEVRDRLIMEAAQKAAKAIEEGTYTDEDLKVLSDFQKYVVLPKVNLAVGLYEQMLELEGDAKEAKKAELNAVRAQLDALSKAPLTDKHTEKLLADAKFEEAKSLKHTGLLLKNYKALGTTVLNVTITPTEADNRVFTGNENFASRVETETEKHLYRTGQKAGEAQLWANRAQRMRNNISVRTENFMQEIQLEAQRMQQPNGYCYRYWRNTQKCIQDSMDRIKELEAIAKHYNEVDAQRAAEYDEKAKYYADLENQGRRYLAAQSGEAVPEDVVVQPTEPDTTKPTPRPQTQDPGVYTFNFNQPGQFNPQMYQQQAQMTPQMHQYPMNPYQNNNMFMQQNPYGTYQQSYMGQQMYPYGNQYGYQAQGSYNFNWGGGAQYGQQPNMYAGYQPQMYGGYQQQQGYWNNPYQAYNQYSIYGRTW